MADVSARVLLVEDDSGLAGVVVRHLRARGHDARVVDSVERAGDVMRDGFRPTVVLLDINLPGASGWDLLRSGALKTAGSPPVYVVSATTVPPARLREFGVAGFLPKPFAMPTLMEIVERTCAAAAGADRVAQTSGDNASTAVSATSFKEGIDGF